MKCAFLSARKTFFLYVTRLWIIKKCSIYEKSFRCIWRLFKSESPKKFGDLAMWIIYSWCNLTVWASFLLIFVDNFLTHFLSSNCTISSHFRISIRKYFKILGRDGIKIKNGEKTLSVMPRAIIIFIILLYLLEEIRGIPLISISSS